jgi:protocatechuate 3,4-dioxygenase beta subunit
MSVNDDELIGRLLSRREVLILTGGVGAAAFIAACTVGAAPNVNAQSDPTVSPGASASAMPSASSSTSAGASASASVAASVVPTCVAAPALTEGPYFVDEKLNRSDIRSNADGSGTRDGAALALSFVIYQLTSGGCTPWSGAVVDVWHCDAAGAYSDVQDRSFDTSGQNWLRGYQVTDANGIATFVTIYPGWYSGRAVHIHFKVRTAPDESSGFEFTSQLFFDDAFSSSVYGAEPYVQHGTTADTPNASDGIYQQSGGQTLLAVEPDGDGYKATIGIALQA